jgi:hypothetical protein
MADPCAELNAPMPKSEKFLPYRAESADLLARTRRARRPFQLAI